MAAVNRFFHSPCGVPADTTAMSPVSHGVIHPVELFPYRNDIVLLSDPADVMLIAYGSGPPVLTLSSPATATVSTHTTALHGYAHWERVCFYSGCDPCNAPSLPFPSFSCRLVLWTEHCCGGAVLSTGPFAECVWTQGVWLLPEPTEAEVGKAVNITLAVDDELRVPYVAAFALA